MAGFFPMGCGGIESMAMGSRTPGVAVAVLLSCFLVATHMEASGKAEALLSTLEEPAAASIAEAPGPDRNALERLAARRSTRTDWFSEFFSFDDADLQFKTYTLTPAAGPNGYTATVDSAFSFPVPPGPGAVDLMLGDDEAASISLGPNSFPLYGVSYNTLHVSSNGIITFTGPNIGSNPTFASHFNTPRISVFHADLQTAAGGGAGTITRTDLPDRIVLTYQGVAAFETSRTNSFQAELFFSGVIRITWLEMQTQRGLVGISAGGGIPNPFFQSNIDLYPTSGPFAALPVEPIRFIGQAGQSSSPSSFPVHLIRKSPQYSSWSGGTSHPWIELFPHSGEFGGFERIATSLRPTAAAASLPVGTHLATATIGAPGFAGATTLAVRLDVLPGDLLLTVTDSTDPLTDQQVTFGEVPVGSEALATVTVNNPGPSTGASVSGIVIDGSYAEDFEDNLAQGWVPRNRVGGENDWRVEDGRLLAGPSALTTGFMESVYALQSFRDVVFEATIEHTGWDGSFAYIAIRGGAAGNGSLVSGSAYLFGISGNNGYTLFRINNGSVQSIFPTSLSPSVRTPPFSNRVRIEAVGPVLTFHANDYYLGGVVDSTLRGAGTIGFVASSVASIDGVFKPAFAFDDIRVRRLPDGSDAFRLVALPAFPANVAAATSLPFGIAASPRSPGPAFATGRILTNSIQRPAIPFFLESTGIPPPVGTLQIADSVAPANDRLVAFGERLVETSTVESVTLTNVSDSHDLDIGALRVLNRIEDPFDDPAMPGWTPSTASHWSQADSAYIANAAGVIDIWMSTTWSDVAFAEGSLTVSVKQPPNDGNSVYLFIRATPDFVLFPNAAAFGSALLLGINSNGFFNLSVFQGGSFRFLRAWEHNEALKTDGAENVITLACQDERILASANGVQLFEGEIPPFIPSGSRAGFFASSGPEGRSFRFEKAIVESASLAAPFSSQGTPVFQTTLPPGGSVLIPVDFAPSGQGGFEGRLRIDSNDFAGPVGFVNLAGSAYLVPFDFNDDGILNVADVTLLSHFVTGKSPTLARDGDVNEDGEVDREDVEALAALIVNSQEDSGP